MKNYIKPEAKFVVIDTDDVMDPGLEVISENDEVSEDEQLAGKGMFENSDEIVVSHVSVWDK